MIRLYNTLTQQKEVFEPLNPGHVSMYVCGPTVYNYIHIGNARSAIAFDVIRRYFEYRGLEVNFVSNFTDVDDKIINAAHEEGIPPLELAQNYINAYMEDVAALNIKPSTTYPRASEMIPQIIAFVERLIDKGYAYESEGDVYYRARRFPRYGELSHKNIDELEQGASQHTNADETARKEDPIDFALWKREKAGEIAWDSPWGPGRPGWHIECSVMSTTLLGDTIDIHGGGQDLEFPHHENEIAQSEGATGETFVNYWLHNGFVTVGEDDEKMSKSLGNFVTVHEILKTIDPQALRFLMSSTQYRKPIRYSQAGLDAAGREIERLKTARTSVSYRLKDAQLGADATIDSTLDDLETRFTTVMDDDINVQNGLTVLAELTKLMNTYAAEAVVYEAALQALLAKQAAWTTIFGLNLDQTADLAEEVEALIKRRDEARAKKDFAESDRLRDQLTEMGITLEDTPQGTRWRQTK